MPKVQFIPYLIQLFGTKLGHGQHVWAGTIFHRELVMQVTPKLPDGSGSSPN